MNLKDNRNNGKNLNSDEKFKFCFSNSIIGIGWVGYGLHSGAKNYDNAKATFDKMGTDDLVWVRNPVTKEYYICEIVKDKENITPLIPHLKTNDISEYKSVNFYKVGTKQYLPVGITYRNLISRSTARKVNNNAVIKSTNELFDNGSAEIEQYTGSDSNIEIPHYLTVIQ